MRHQDIRKQLAESVDHLLQEDGLPIALRPYQRDTLASVARWLRDPAGTQRGYIAHATGLGKTLLFSSLVRAAIGLRSLIIVPTRVLVEQTVQMLHRLTGGMIAHWSSVPNIESGIGETIATIGHQYADILVTTDESFVRYWGQMRKEFDPDLIIWDECHTGYAGKPQRALAAFEHPVIIGCTATPDYLSAVDKKGCIAVTRANGAVLFQQPELTAAQHFQQQLDERDLAWGIGNAWLSPLAWGSIDIAAELDHIPLTKTDAGWDFNQMALQKVMSRHWPSVIQAVLGAYRDNKPYAVAGKRAYALCPGVANALQLARDLTQEGVPAECISGDTDHKRRRLYLQQFNEGKIKFLSSVMVLREGWDAPDAEVCWMLRPTYSYVLYVQGIGRVLRNSPTNPHKVAMVIDPSFRGTTLSPLNVPALFLPPPHFPPVGASANGAQVILRPSAPQQASSSRPAAFYASLDEATAAVRGLGFVSRTQYNAGYRQDRKLPSNPDKHYADRGWNERGGWAGFLGIQNHRTKATCYKTIEDAAAAVRRLGIDNQIDYRARYREDTRLPALPREFYGEDAWKEHGGWPGFFGDRKHRLKDQCYATVVEAAAAARKLGITNREEYRRLYRQDLKLPAAPDQMYDSADWERIGRWAGFLSGAVARF